MYETGPQVLSPVRKPNQVDTVTWNVTRAIRISCFFFYSKLSSLVCSLRLFAHTPVYPQPTDIVYSTSAFPFYRPHTHPHTHRAARKIAGSRALSLSISFKFSQRDRRACAHAGYVRARTYYARACVLCRIPRE